MKHVEEFLVNDIKFEGQENSGTALVFSGISLIWGAASVSCITTILNGAQSNWHHTSWI